MLRLEIKEMAKQRVINTKFWDDGYIAELGPAEKLVFLYVLTSPLTDLCGAYEITLRRISIDTGIRPNRLLDILAEFERAGKIIYRDGWILVRNFAKHQVKNPKVTEGIKRSLSACPDWIKDTLSKPIVDHRTLTLTSRENLDLKGEPKPLGESATTEETPQAAKAKKGIRLSDEFFLTSEMRAWAHERKPDVDLVLETEKFCNHFRAAPGTKGTKLDWLLTWKNWILNARGKNGTNRPHSTERRDTSTDRLAGHEAVLAKYSTEAELRENGVDAHRSQ